MADTQLTVVGAGVVGLAIAARLARRFPDLVVLERRARHGTETSSRNSQVIHAGIYYPTGSLKARLCVEGKHLLYEACARHELPHRRLGKLIAAMSDGETEALERLMALAAANGVPLRMLSARQARALEPHVPCVGALESESTGIVDVHALMDFLLARAAAAGATLQPRSALIGVERRDHDYRLTVRSGENVESLTSARVVNAAGLEADTVAGLPGIDVDAAGYRQHFCKGSYFAVAPRKASVVSRLVYPVPNPYSLGVHALLDVGGRLRFGPDAEYLEGRALDYGVDESKRKAFAQAVRRLVPAIEEEDLTPDIAGIRPKVQRQGQPMQDFVIREESARGLPGFVNLVGMESPALTACLAIAEHVAALLDA